MAVSRRGDHAVEHRALDGQRARERAAQPRAAQGEQQRSLGPRQLDGRPPVGRRRGVVGQQPRPLPPPYLGGPEAPRGHGQGCQLPKRRARGCEGWGLCRGVGVFERGEQWARAALSAGAHVCRPAFPPAAPLVLPQRHRLVGVAAEGGQPVRHHALRRPLARPLRMQDLQPGAVAPSGWGEASATA